MNTTKFLGPLSLSLSVLFIMGCASSAEEPNEPKEDEVSTPAIEQTLTPKDEYLGEWGPYDPPEYQYRCYNQYSDVVAVYIDYAPWHCEGWTGKVFCEYESLSSVYGPGWGQCQCYNTVCGWMMPKRGRTCRYRRCY